MARMVNGVIGKKNKTWCEYFILEAMPTAHNRSHPWRGFFPFPKTNRTLWDQLVQSGNRKKFDL